MGVVIGIDLGTTNSCVACIEDGVPTVVPNKAGYKTTPSVVAITHTNKRLIGHAAKRQAITNPTNTVTAAKRFIGREWDSPEVQAALVSAPYELMKGPHDDVRIQLQGKGLLHSRNSSDASDRVAQNRRGTYRRPRDQGRHYRSRLFQRRPTSCHQKSRADCRAGGDADHQRTHQRSFGLRLRQGGKQNPGGLRPGRRYLRHLHLGGQRERLRSHYQQRRHLPGRRGFR